jgi:predicted dehydrogenase
VVLKASRTAIAEQDGYAFEVHGTTGSSVRGHGEYAAFQPGAGIAMSYHDLKVIEAHGFLSSIADGKAQGATVHDAVRTALVLDAMSESAASGGWVRLRSGRGGGEP